MPNVTQAAYQGFNKEIRFAVVMYGGVSLAIYINGVAQELLKMCRATSGWVADPENPAVEDLYLQIGEILANQELAEDLIAIAKSGQKAKKAEKDIDDEIEYVITAFKGTEQAKNPPVSFIVDILSGTSAGGINAIFLAKALARDRDITSLKELWKRQGDISILLNDRKSVADNDLDVPATPRSLLNSDRMFVELLKAFDRMDPDDRTNRAPLFDEIDLFVTTTDFRGVVVPIRLLDGVVEEKSFRQVFHFKVNTEDKKNDFSREHDPMLAFASRATSSFPFAFEPMRLSSARKVIEQCFGAEKVKALDKYADAFFPNLVDKSGVKIDWKERDLVDGGVLDNKPFSHAISVLTERRSDFQVTRKLLYVEPSPESFGNRERVSSGKPPDAIDNALASLSSIPGYETIRGDLERLTERNALIDRVNLIVAHSEQDVFKQLIEAKKSAVTEPRRSSKWWATQGLDGMAEVKGRAVLPYYRLRIAALTDEIARIVTTILGIDANSEYFTVIRGVVKTWREAAYNDYKSDLKPGQEPVLAFLKNLDMVYRLRRLRFVQQKLSRLYFFDDEFTKEMRDRSDSLKNIKPTPKKGGHWNPMVEPDIDVPPKTSVDLKQALHVTDDDRSRKPSQILSLVGGASVENIYQLDIQRACGFFLAPLADLYGRLQKTNRGLEKASWADEVREACRSLRRAMFIMDATSEERALRMLTRYQTFERAIQITADNLKTDFDTEFKTARETIDKLRKLRAPGVEPVISDSVRSYMMHYYDNFDDYDQMSYPIFYEAQVGEAAKVDVMRISPADAKSLIDLSDPNEKRKKVAGESLGHFGAFLDATWRWNDIMWGRLDGAERLVAALMPGNDYESLRKYFTRKMHILILQEEMGAENLKDLKTVLAESLARTRSGSEYQEVIRRVVSGLDHDPVRSRLNSVLNNVFCEPEDLYNFVKVHYEFPQDPEPKLMLDVIGRSTQVTGGIFRGIADGRGVDGKRFAIVSRMGQIFWGLVQIAAPNSIWNMLLGQWLFLLYFFETLLIVTSTMFGRGDVQQFGIVLLTLTILLHLSVTAMHDWMRGRTILYIPGFFATAIALFLFGSGTAALYAFFYNSDLWTSLERLHGPSPSPDIWQKLIPLSLLIMLMLAIFTWRDMRNSRIRIYGGVILVSVILIVVSGVIMENLASPADGIAGLPPILSLEFARTPADIRAIAGELGPAVAARAGLKWALLIDSFIFVPLYASFLLFYARLFNFWGARRPEWRERLLGITSICILAMAGADLVENFFSYQVLLTALADANVDHIRWISYAAYCKWFLFAVVTALTSVMFWRENWWRLFTFVFLAAALVGFFGLYWHPAIQLFMLSLIGVLVVVGSLFIFAPKTFATDHP